MQKKIIYIGVLLLIGIFLSSYLLVFTIGKAIISVSVNDGNNASSYSSDSKTKSDNSRKEESTEEKKELSDESKHKEKSEINESSDVSGNSIEESTLESNESDDSNDVYEQSDQESSDMDPESESESESESEPEDNTGNDENLVDSLSTAGYSIDYLSQVDCQQIITVNSNGNYAEISFYQLDENGIWKNDPSLTTDGYVGWNGVSQDIYEGGNATPFGLYGVGEAFYIDTMIETGLDIFQVTQDTYWVDDPDSSFYNQRVEGTENMDWNSAEHMIDYYDSYRFGFVIEYNTQNTIPGKGSAFFFHISGQPTAGCVGTSEVMVLKYLNRLDKNLKPYILMQ